MRQIISILTNSKVGPWNIPSRGQSFINNYYANVNGYKVTHVYNAGLFFNFFKDFNSIIGKKIKNKNSIIVFCSTFQIMDLNTEKKNFINYFKKFETHFALEYKKGKGEKFLKSIFNEIDDYKKSKKLNISGINTYTNLFKKYKKKIL
tara:strand:- start:4708 stop:5151 length:444 start_codon:yes stop_codon:yes gene_type:complete